MWRLIVASSIALGVAGCAIHPLPDNVTHLQTREIVHHIRCEARAAIRQAIIDYLRKIRQTGLMEQLDNRTLPLESLDAHLNELPPPVRAKIIKYEGAAITYDFSFDITEQNTVTAEVDFVNLLSSGTFSMPARGTNDLQRQTVRIFRVNDGFHDLMLMSSSRCTDDGSPENPLYPVSGTIGLGEMVETFVDLNEFQHLVGPKDAETVPTMADTFNFTTTASGSITPQVTLTPLNRFFNVSGASLAASGQRKDIHQVIVAISLPAPAKSAPVPGVRGFLGSSQAPSRQPASAVDRNNAAIDNTINRSIINRLGRP